MVFRPHPISHESPQKNSFCLILCRNWKKLTTFAKNTAHIERRLRKNAYLCRRGGKSVADMT
jgi:hypothetical protein